MSDISLNWGSFAYAFIALIIGSPGLAIGGVLGALLWRGHRLAGAVLGAIAGFALWLVGWLYFNDVI